MNRLPPLLALLCSACTLDSFLFNPVAVDEYRWDEVDPNLDGELTAPHPSVVPAEDRFEGFVTADGDAIHYVYARRPGATRTIFYSHGNARNLGRYWDRTELMWELGYNVMIYDYPGYGRSEGEPDEAGLYASAEAVLEVLPDMPGVDMNQIYLVGYSMGGPPTFHLATNTGHTGVLPRGLLTEATFCSVQTMLEDGSFLDLPREFVSRNPLDNCDKIGRVPTSVRKIVLHGDADDFLRPVHAERLAEEARAPFELVWANGGAHSDIPLVMGQEYQALLRRFVGG